MTSRRNGEGVAVTRARSVEFTPPAPTSLGVRPTTDAADFFREQAEVWEQLPPFSQEPQYDLVGWLDDRLVNPFLGASKLLLERYRRAAASCGNRLLDLPDGVLPRSVARPLDADPRPAAFVALALMRAGHGLPTASGKLDHISGPQLRSACALLCREVAGWIDAAAGGSREQTDSKPERNGSDPQLEWLEEETRRRAAKDGGSETYVNRKAAEIRTMSSDALEAELERLNATTKPRRWSNTYKSRTIRSSATYKKWAEFREALTKQPDTSGTETDGRDGTASKTQRTHLMSKSAMAPEDAAAESQSERLAREADELLAAADFGNATECQEL